MGFRCLCFLPIFVLIRVETVPPESCFANFRWDDCGKPPTPVMYYWKPGSRCEVGLWRGCLPNLNMFPDEYECVTTCIFTSRVMAADYHSINENEIEGITDYPTEVDTESDYTTDMLENTTFQVTTVGDGGGADGTTDVSGTGGDGTATVTGNAVTGSGGEGEAETTVPAE